MDFNTVALIVVLLGVLTCFKFSMFAQLYLIFFTVVCAYEIGALAGKMGLAPLGRFATFVLMPAMFLFGLNHVQIVVLSVFVEVAIGTTADALFGKKMGALAQVDKNTLRRFQLFGLIISSLCIGIIFWLLIKQFGLGTEYLTVQRAQSRALLVSFKNFNMTVLALGLIFGYFLKLIKVNPALVLGGLLMPFNFSIGLILGGLSTYLVKSREEWEPFWSGVYVSNAVWMLAKALVKIL